MLDCTRIPVAELVPHDPPMVLLERIVSYDSKNLVAEVVITADSMFYDAALDGVPAWVGIEYMAQAIAALSGLRAREKQLGPKLGFLLGTRKMLLVQKVLRAGQVYSIHVKELIWDDSGLANFECRILDGQEACVEAKLNVFETRDMKMPAKETSDG